VGTGTWDYMFSMYGIGTHKSKMFKVEPSREEGDNALLYQVTTGAGAGNSVDLENEGRSNRKTPH
jgi:hypothetical protein